ncbi:MAG TPA: DUF4190 domain-containing protein [Actinomycetota bacterium]|nr:DUF4190 domain-containing protein [Actinomycetota bacterium]
MSRSTEAQATTGPRKNGVGVAALVIGVLALVLALLVLFFPIAALLGLIAIILGIVGISRASRGEADNRGQALAGLITGLVGLLLAVFFTISIGAFFATHQNDFRQFGNCMLGADDRQQRSECGRELTDKLDQP